MRTSPSLQDLHKRTTAQLLHRQPRGQRFLLGDGAAVHRPQAIVEQALARGRVVEYVANQRGLSRLLDEIAQALGCRRESLQKERVDGGVARRKLGRSEVPSLIV